MPIDASSQPRSRNPWSVVAGAGLTQALSGQPLVLATFSLFVLPLAQATGWSRASILAVFTSCAVGLAIGLPLVGRLLDRFPLRRVLIVSWIGYCTCTAAVAVVPLSLPLFYLPYFLVGIFSSGVVIPCTKSVVTWFDKRRGAGIGVMAALMGLGTAGMPILAAHLIKTVGFREAYLWLALFALVVGMTLILTLVRPHAQAESVLGAHPQRGGALPDQPGTTVGEALRTRRFWLIAFALCLAAISVTGFQANLVPILLDRHSSQDQATLALSVFGLASLVGRLGGVLLDRFHGTKVGATVLLLAAFGVSLILIDHSFAVDVAGALLIGVAFGIEIDLLAFLATRYFGMRQFGSIMGALQGGVMLCIAFGPMVVGLAYDQLGSYAAVLPLLIGTFILSGFAFSLAIDTVCPECSKIMQEFAQKAQLMNNLNINSCELAQGLVGGIWPKGDLADKAICEAIGNSEGIFTDYAAAKHGCGTRGQRTSTTAAGAGKYDDVNPGVPRNYTWTILKKSAFFSPGGSLDQELAE